MSETAAQLRSLADAVALLEDAGVEVRDVTPYFPDGGVNAQVEVTIEGDVDLPDAAAQEFLDSVAEQTGGVDQALAHEDDQDDAPEPADPERSPGAATAEPAITEADGSVETPDVTENGHDVDGEDDDGDDRLDEGYCGDCGRGSFNERGLQIHHGKAGHDGDPEMVAEPPGEPDENGTVQNGHAGLFDDADPSLPEGIDEATLFSVAEHYDTLGDVAEDLEVDYERAGAILGDNGLLDRVTVEGDLEVTDDA